MRSHSAGLLSVNSQLDRFAGIVGAGPGHDRHALGGNFDAQLDHTPVLGMRQGRGFAGGADGDETGAALGDQPIDMGGEGSFVDSARIGEGGNESGNGSPEHARLLKARLSRFGRIPWL